MVILIRSNIIKKNIDGTYSKGGGILQVLWRLRNDISYLPQAG